MRKAPAKSIPHEYCAQRTATRNSVTAISTRRPAIRQEKKRFVPASSHHLSSDSLSVAMHNDQRKSDVPSATHRRDVKLTRLTPQAAAHRACESEQARPQQRDRARLRHGGNIGVRSVQLQREVANPVVVPQAAWSGIEARSAVVVVFANEAILRIGTVSVSAKRSAVGEVADVVHRPGRKREIHRLLVPRRI